MKRILLIVLCVNLMISCRKEETPDPAPPATPAPVTPAPTGTLTGKVSHYDQFGTEYTTGLNTTSVTIEGKNSTTTTDEDGRYTFTGVLSGTYTLVFQKPGCGTTKLQDIIFKATDLTEYNSKIADIPVFSISSAYAKDTSWYTGTLNGIYYNANTLPVNSKATIVAIVGESPNTTISDPRSYYNYATASIANTLDFNRFLSYSLLKDTYLFMKDSTIFIKIYPVSTTGASYFDNKLKKPIYTAFGNAFPTTFTFVVK
jgi:hypothetical protein